MIHGGPSTSRPFPFVITVTFARVQKASAVPNLPPGTVHRGTAPICESSRTHTTANETAAAAAVFLVVRRARWHLRMIPTHLFWWPAPREA